AQRVAARALHVPRAPHARLERALAGALMGEAVVLAHVARVALRSLLEVLVGAQVLGAALLVHKALDRLARLLLREPLGRGVRVFAAARLRVLGRGRGGQ